MKKQPSNGKAIMKYANKLFLTAALIFSFVLTSCSSSPEQTAPSSSESEIAKITVPKIEDITSDGTDDTQSTDSGTDTSSAETDAPTVSISKRISFIGMGDNLIHSPIFKQSKKSDGTYDFLPKYADIKDTVQSADIAFINQETPMCGEEYGYHNYPQFNTPQQMGRDLVTLGFDVISFANNHMNDQGSAALEKMIDFPDTLDTLTVGLYRSEDDFDDVRILEHDGVKIAFLAYTYGVNIRASKDTDSIIPLYDDETLTKHITYAKEVSDVVIVSMHWGKENRSTVSDEQVQTAQLIADLGADVILVHHPHVVQKVEWLDGKDGNRTLCYYSLGNGINSQDYLKNMVGITASFDIVIDNGECTIENASVIPTFCQQTKSYGNAKLYLLENLTDEMAKKHHCNYKGDTVTVEAARKIVTDTVDKKFLPDYLIEESNDE